MSLSQRRYLISAGEFSGDLLAAELVRALKSVLPQHRAFGCAGISMEEAGVEAILKQSDFNMMGIWDVVKSLPKLSILEKQLLAKIDDFQPEFAVLVDFPAFHFRLAEQLRLRGIKVFQYVAPKIWAWGERRAELLRRDFTEVFGVFPFEEAFFAEKGVPFTYVGTPHIDRCAKILVKKEDFGFSPTEPLVAILPGSRRQELQHLMPTLQAVMQNHQDRQFIIPVASNLTEDDLRCIHPGAKYGLPFQTLGNLTLVRGMSLEAMKIADVALVCSGTATLECALLGTPCVVIYATDESTYEIAKSALKINAISLINLLLKRHVVKEFVQHFSVQDIEAEMTSLLCDQEKRARMLETFQELRDQMRGRAAQVTAERIYSLVK